MRIDTKGRPQRPPIPDATKAAAVARYLDGTNPSGDTVGHEFGVSQSTVARWVREFRAGEAR